MFNNVFKDTGVSYFHLPHEVFTTQIWRELLPSAKALYPFLLARLWEQNNGDKSVRLAVEEIRDGAGLASKHSIIKAREDLESRGLIHTSRTKGGHIYTVLNPVNGMDLVKIDDFNDASLEQLKAYFMHHVAEFEPEDTELADVLRCRCPFHHSTKARRKTLTIGLSKGGWFGCSANSCGKKGKLVAFEMAMAARHGEHITSTRAQSNVKRLLLKIATEKQQAEARELAARQAGLGITEIPTSWDE